MHGYFDYFPAKTGTELRTVTFVNMTPKDAIPNGRFVFTEYFCTDLDCDCQRVLIKVFRADSGDVEPEEVATISYTWNERDDWLPGMEGMSNPFLDPFHRQVDYAEDLLDYWFGMLENDSPYSARLERHYHELRAAHSQSSHPQEKIWTPAKKSSDRSPMPTPTLTNRERRTRKRKLEQTKRIRKSR
jgi:hypothetical protein